MATYHVTPFDTNCSPPACDGWEEPVVWGDGELFDLFFQGDSRFTGMRGSLQVDTSKSVTSDFPSAPPSVEEFPISDNRFSWPSSAASTTTFANSPFPLECDNDRVYTESFDPYNPLAFHQDFDSLGGWADQLPTIEPILDNESAITIPHLNPRTSSSSTSSSSSWVEIPQINEPPLETETPRGIAIPQRNPRARSSTATSTSTSTSSPSNLGWVQYQVNTSTRRLVPSGAGPNGGRRQRGRTRGLTPDQRKNAALMRVVKACSNCRKRKERCDPGIPCKSCIEHFKGDLVNHPCREKLLADLSTVFLSERLGWHPSARSLDSFLGVGSYTVSSTEYTIQLSLGFGPYLYRRVRQVWTTDVEQLYHRHIVYNWPPSARSTTSGGTPCHHAVFPAVLASTADLKESLDAHLTDLVDSHFRHFPLFCSPLRILRDIYVLYKKLPAPHARILQQSLKLLVLVHIGGDTTLSALDPTVAHMMAAAGLVTTSEDGTPVAPTPCFIRGQLGAEMPALAQELMRDVLARLERLALSRQCAQWPVIVSSLAVLLMTVESIQYHAAKVGYHASSFDAQPAHQLIERAKCQALDEQGVDALLGFYRACYGGCHARLSEDGADEAESIGGGGPGVKFVDALRAAIKGAGPYLEERRSVSVEKLEDMNCFFDRLLAKLFELS
ncbi:hypothetical protein AOQ84DRAFT_185372 [Glonium stellatum]|uniref:Zn(2)-C6 fungal-type domain-containing protein n=1 Tax=Glonium stellatum TaxID=574774 RepID=A0A8E2F6V7_9PEZI|nr:hypothetical protein AOQ84DRAFT_185372 [Glonium stellatum]